MDPDLAAQIIANVWLDPSFALALLGPDPRGAIQAKLGVTVPPDTPLPVIPPRPTALIEGLRVESRINMGISAWCWFSCGCSDCCVPRECQIIISPRETNLGDARPAD